MTLIIAILVGSGIISFFIFITTNCIQGSIYDASYRVVFALEALTEKLEEINNNLNDKFTSPETNLLDESE